MSVAEQRRERLLRSHLYLVIEAEPAERVVPAALDGGADGVHLGQDDAPVESARQLVGGELLIGFSTHSPEQIDAGLEYDADYLGVGPVYETATKPGVKPVGLELVRDAAARGGRKPWFAIGGIDEASAPAVAEAGAPRH